MTWFLYCMAKHSEHQVRNFILLLRHLLIVQFINFFKQQLVIEEWDEVFGYSDRACTTQDGAELKYFECCIKETLRLYPNVPAGMRYITEDILVGNKAFTYPSVSFHYANSWIVRELQNTCRRFSRVDDL